MDYSVYKSLLFIVNPVSGKKNAHQYVPDAVKRFEEKFERVDTVYTQKEKNAYEIVKEQGGGYDVIVCAGGDGTLKEAVSGIIETQCKAPLGYIPMGSTNDFARSLGIPRGNINAALDNILEGEPCPVDIGQFEGECFIYVASFGNFTALSYTANQKLKNLIGRPAYYLGAVKDFFKIRPYHARVEADGESFEGDYFVGGVTNSYGVGGMPVLHNIGVKFDDGLHELVLVEMYKNPKEMLSFVGAMLKKDFINNPLVTIRHCRDFRFEFDEPTAFTLDGEFGGDLTEAIAKTLVHAVSIILKGSIPEEK